MPAASRRPAGRRRHPLPGPLRQRHRRSAAVRLEPGSPGAGRRGDRQPGRARDAARLADHRDPRGGARRAGGGLPAGQPGLLGGRRARLPVPGQPGRHGRRRPGRLGHHHRGAARRHQRRRRAPGAAARRVDALDLGRAGGRGRRQPERARGAGARGPARAHPRAGRHRRPARPGRRPPPVLCRSERALRSRPAGSGGRRPRLRRRRRPGVGARGRRRRHDRSPVAGGAVRRGGGERRGPADRSRRRPGRGVEHPLRPVSRLSARRPLRPGRPPGRRRAGSGDRFDAARFYSALLFELAEAGL